MTEMPGDTERLVPRTDTHREEVGPALRLLPDRRGGVGSGGDIDPKLLLAGARGRGDGGGVVT